MQTTTMFAAMAAVLALAAAPALGDAVNDESFDNESQRLAEELQLHSDIGAFGRPGDMMLDEAAPTASVGDRDLDRYVARLGLELRMRNALADREQR